MKAEAAKAVEEAKASVSTPETTADQVKDSTTSDTPPAKKKPTAAETRKELEDLRTSALATRQRLTAAEVTAQRARTILKSEGTPGMSLQQDHYRLTNMVRDLRKLLQVEPEEITGGQ